MSNNTATLDVTKAWSSQTFKHDRQLTCFRFSACGKYVAAGGMDRLLHLWEIESGNRRTPASHASWIGDLAFHSDGQRLFSGDYRGALYCWPYTKDSPQPLWTVKDTGHGWVRTIAVSLDGKYVATGGNDRAVRLWSSVDGKLVREFTGHESYVFNIAMHPDGKSLASGDLLGRVNHWELETGKLIRTLDASVLHTRGDDFLADVGGVRALAFDPPGALLVCGGMTNAQSNTFCPGDPAVVVFDWASGKHKTDLKVTHKADGPINSLRFLSDGTLAAIGEGSGGASLAFWKTDKSEPLHFIKSTSGYALDVHPDGLRLAVAQFDTIGRGGNGRHTKPEEYVSNGTSIAIYNLYEK